MAAGGRSRCARAGALGAARRSATTVTCSGRLWRAGPSPEVIATGSGGDPFDGAGWTDWLDLDAGYRRVALVHARPVLPDRRADAHGQRGPTARRSSRRAGRRPTRRRFRHPSDGRSVVTLTSRDNRASSILDPSGALVSMTVPLGEPGSVGTINNPRAVRAERASVVHREPAARRPSACEGSSPGGATRSDGRAEAPSCTEGRMGSARCRSGPSRPLPIARGDGLTLIDAARPPADNAPRGEPAGRDQAARRT